MAKKATRKRTTRKAGAAKRQKTTAVRGRKTAAKSAKPPARPAKRAKSAARKRPRSNAAVTVRGALAGAAAAVARRLPGRNAEPDALELLERDHRRFEDLLKQGEESTTGATTQRRKLLRTITAELNAHELMEEKVLYPALQSHPAARDIVLEGYEEHHVADVIVEELHQVATDDEQWSAKFKVLKESLEHHIQEEEGEMFRKARGIFSRDELQELAARMLALKTRSGAASRRARS